MSFLDLIKKSVVEEFTGSIATSEILFSLIVAFLSAVIITLIYKKTYTGVSYTKAFSLSIILLAMVTSLVIRTINSNLALSLGMVGALSIVRFRTAVKDPIDTIFMFWAITTGIMSGAGLYLITLIATLILGILYIFSYMINFKSSKKYLLVIKMNKENVDSIKKIVNQKDCLLKTESYQKNTVELTYELVYNQKILDDIKNLQDKKGIDTINLINVD